MLLLNIPEFVLWTQTCLAKNFPSYFPIILSPASSACPENRPSSGGDRKKWEAGVPLIPPLAQQTLEQTCFTTIGEFLSLTQSAGTETLFALIHLSGFQSKQPVRLFRCRGCMKKPHGRCGE